MTFRNSDDIRHFLAQKAPYATHFVYHKFAKSSLMSFMTVADYEWIKPLFAVDFYANETWIGAISLGTQAYDVPEDIKFPIDFMIEMVMK